MNVGDVSNKQRKRAVNFSEAEKIILIDLVTHYKDVIENKRSDMITSKEKNKYWKIIEQKFNSTSSTEFRNSEVLKSCWDNLKKKTRKFFAEEKMKLYKTGGGPYESRSDTTMERVRHIIKSSVDGLTNTFDSDTVTETSENLHTVYKILNVNKHDSTTQNTSSCNVSAVLNTNLNKMTNTIIIDENLSENNSDVIYEDDTNVVYEDSQNVLDSVNNIEKYSKEKADTQKLQGQEINLNKPKITAIEILKKKISTPFQIRSTFLNNQCDLENIPNICGNTNYNNENYNNGDQNMNEISVNEDSSYLVNNIENYCKKKAAVQKSQEQEINRNKLKIISAQKKSVSMPLQTRRKFSNNQYDSDNVNNHCTLRKKRKDNTSSRFSVLTESKTELVEYMKEDLKAKSNVEIQILNMQLKKEELEIQLLEKELLLKDHILQRELQKLI